MMSVCFDEP
ncbi:hypothetical protein D030_2566A, partial [Vibrio parahaemolyticus AQ3810]